MGAGGAEAEGGVGEGKGVLRRRGACEAHCGEVVIA